jgi:putative hydrolase of the HAD superfamily
MEFHLFTDADNTLWDTNAVFARAQLAMLRDVEAASQRTVPLGVKGRLGFLRRIDQYIAVQHPDHLGYPPMLLAQGLLLALRGATANEAVSQVLSRPDADPLLESIVERFVEQLRRLPRLRRGVRRGIAELSEKGVQITVISETSQHRCIDLLSEHALAVFISEVVSVRKTPQAYRRLAERHRGLRTAMVGDQLDRDVLFASQAGFETVYFPSAFQPQWLDEIAITPDHRIERYDDIVEVLNI